MSGITESLIQYKIHCQLLYSKSLHKDSVTPSRSEFFPKSCPQDSQYAYVSMAGKGERKGTDPLPLIGVADQKVTAEGGRKHCSAPFGQKNFVFVQKHKKL